MLHSLRHYNEFGKKRIEGKKPVLSLSKYSLLSQFGVVLFSIHARGQVAAGYGQASNELPACQCEIR